MWSFFHENTNFGWSKDGHLLLEVTTEDEIRKYEYHPLSPLVIINENNPHFILKTNEESEKFTTIPAFFLYGNRESAFWEDLIAFGEYAIDIVTTFSGVGNILKAGRLFRLLKGGKTLIFRSKLATKTIAHVKQTAGVIEVSSGAANALLKLMGTEDTPFGRAISKYLFWLEMLSLSGELTVALQATLKKNAIEVLEHTDELAKLEKQANEVLAKNLDQKSVLAKEAEETLELVRHLEETVEPVLEKLPLGKRIDGKPLPNYKKGFEYYLAEAAKIGSIPLVIRRISRKLMYSVDKEVSKLLDPNSVTGLSKGKEVIIDRKGRKYIRKKWLTDRQLVAGLTHSDKKLGEIIVLKTNFPTSELKLIREKMGITKFQANLSDIKKLYAHFKQKGHIDFEMHPKIEELLIEHFDQLAKQGGVIKHPTEYRWKRTAGLPGVHAEVLALNDLLWKLEQSGIVLNEKLMKGFIGFNIRIVDKAYMIRCGDCQLILRDVLFLEKITNH